MSPRVFQNGTLGVLPIPLGCGASHTCPVCAATAAAARARALRAVLGAMGQKRIFLVTLTHRDQEGEALADGLARLRRAWDMVTKGTPGKAWKARVEGWYYGDEAPRSWDGKHKGSPAPSSESRHRWHVHRHVVVTLDADADADAVRQWLGGRWRAASAAAAQEAGLPGHGWDAAAGGCKVDDEGNVTSWAGGWWKEIDASDAHAVYQACKYPSPAAELGPVALAEYVAVAHGRRWHGGGGSLRSVMKLAAEIEAEGFRGDLGEEGDEEPKVDLGVNLALMVPGKVPTLERVAPWLGIEGAPWPALPVPGVLRWVLAGDVDTRAIRPAVEELGGALEAIEVDGKAVWRLVLPAAWSIVACAELSAALRAARDARDALHPCKGTDSGLA